MRIKFLKRPAAGKVCFWLDLDNTLHNASVHILPEINESMTQYVAQHLNIDSAKASELRNAYWLRYGATLLGMMKHHDVCPHHFLKHTHVLPKLKEQVLPDPQMRHLLRRLPGNKIILTNAPLAYAIRVLALLRIQPLVHAVIAIDQMSVNGRLRPKPSGFLWPAVKRLVPARKHVLFEDTASHLKSVRAHQMKTVWVVPPRFPKQSRAGKPAHIDRKVTRFSQSAAWSFTLAQTGQAGSLGTLMR